MNWLTEGIHNRGSILANPQRPANLKEAFQQLAAQATGKGIAYFRSTPTGQALEAEATRQKLLEIAKNPITIVAGLLFAGYLMFKILGSK